MANQPKKRPGWQGIDGTVYEFDDARLIGQGNPPADPEFARANPGRGQRPLIAIIIEEGK